MTATTTKGVTMGNYIIDPITGEKVWTTNLDLLRWLGVKPIKREDPARVELLRTFERWGTE